MRFAVLLLPLLVLTQVSRAQCPGDDPEPAVSVKTSSGPTLFICGFEDRDVQSPKGKRAFSDFGVYFTTEKQTTAQKVFAPDSSETFWARTVLAKGFELEELWFFSEKPQSAFKSEITCTAETCVASAAKCVLQMKKNPFPKALGEFQKRAAAGTLKDDGEELIDQIFAQAFQGDKAAQAFYAAPPAKLEAELAEAFSANKKKLELGCPR